MDNNKIGKLIAELRKKKGLTQQDLGDMVGVGFKAVSKWECGTTLPDITIINEVSKILGITTDELLAGELNKPEEVLEEKIEEPNNDKKKKPKLIITISILTILLVFITSLFIYQNSNKTYTYKLVSKEPELYHIEGKLYMIDEKISIMTNELRIKDEKLENKIIQNYEYSIIVNKEAIIGYGYIGFSELLEEPISISEFTKEFTINHDVKTNLKNEDITKNDIILKIKFLTTDNKIIDKELYILAKKIK